MCWFTEMPKFLDERLTKLRMHAKEDGPPSAAGYLLTAPITAFRHYRVASGYLLLQTPDNPSTQQVIKHRQLPAASLNLRIFFDQGLHIVR